ncbi:MAG: T9SS type A sorting domain-containing protein [Bacteroidales bacterium]
MSGDKVLCYLSTKTYSVQDFHNVTYSWSTSPNLQINGSITGRSVSVSPTSSANGSGYVKVTIDIQDNNETRVMSKNVWVGSPTIYASDMIFTNTFGDSEYLCTSHYGNEVSWSYSYPYDYWDVRVSNSDGTQVLYTQRVDNTSASLDYTSLSPGFYLVGVRGANECGTGAWNDTEVMWSDCSQDGEGGDIYSLELTPNPVTNESEIEVFRNDGKTIEDNFRWEVEVYDFGMNLKSKPNKIYGNKHKIKAHSWKKGIYIIRAYIDDEIIIKKFMKK